MADVILVRQPCEVCGNEEVQGHHDDYTKPYEIRWLCRSHHRLFHVKVPGRDLPGYEDRAIAYKLVARAMPPGDTVKVSAKVPEDHVRELEEMAHENGRSMAAEIRLAVHDWLREGGYIDA